MYRETGAQYDVRVRMHAPSIQKGQMAVRLIADFNADMDLDGDGTIGTPDYQIFIPHWGYTA